MKSSTYSKRSISPTPAVRANLPEKWNILKLEGVSSDRSVSPFQSRAMAARASAEFNITKTRQQSKHAQDKRSLSPVPRRVDENVLAGNQGSKKFDYPAGPGSARIYKLHENRKVETKSVVRTSTFRKSLRKVFLRSEKKLLSELFFERWIVFMASQSQARMKESASAFVLSIRSQSNQQSLEAYFFRWSQQLLQFKAEDLKLRMKASDEASRALVEVVNERTNIMSQSQHDIEVYEYLVDKKLRSEQNFQHLMEVFYHWKQLQQLAGRFSCNLKSLIKYWRALVLKARSQKMKLERVMQAYKRRSMFRSITDWQHTYSFDKNARVQIERKQRNVLRNAWMSWKMEFESTRENQLTCRGWQRDIISHMRREILVLWRMSCVIGRILVRRANVLNNKRRSTLQRVCIEEWTKRTKEAASCEKKVQRLLSLKLISQTRNTFLCWSRAALRSFKLPTGRIHKWAVHIKRKLALSVLNSWEDLIQNASKQRQLIRDRSLLMFYRTKNNMFRRWKALVDTSIIKCEHAKILVRKQERLLVKDHFTVWRSPIAFGVRRVMLAEANEDEREEKTRLSSVLQQAKVFSVLFNLQEMVPMELVVSVKAAIVHESRGEKEKFAQDDNQDVSSDEPAAQVMLLPLEERKRTRRIFEGWRCLAVSSSFAARKVDVKLMIRRTKQVGRALVGWIHLRWSSKRVRDLSLKIRTREDRRKRSSLFLLWRQVCDNKVRKRLIVGRCIAARSSQSKRSILGCWMDIVSDKKVSESLGRSCYTLKRRKILRQHVAVWSAFSARQLRLFHQERRIVRRSQAAMIRKCLLVWIRSSVSKHLQPLVEKFVGRKSQLVLKSSFDRVCKYHLRCRRMQSVVTGCGLRRSHRLLHSVLLRWAKETTRQESLNYKVKSFSMLHGWRLTSKSFKSLLGNSRDRSNSPPQSMSHTSSIWDQSLVHVCSPLPRTPDVSAPPALLALSPSSSHDVSSWAIGQLSFHIMRSAMRGWRCAVEEARLLNDFADMWNNNCETILGKVVVCFYSWHRISLFSRYETEEASFHSTNELQKRLLLLLDVKRNCSKLFLQHQSRGFIHEAAASGSEHEDGCHPLSSSSTASTLSQHLEHASHYPLHASTHSDLSPGSFPFHDLYVSCFPRNDVNYILFQIAQITIKIRRHGQTPVLNIFLLQSMQRTDNNPEELKRSTPARRRSNNQFCVQRCIKDMLHIHECIQQKRSCNADNYKSCLLRCGIQQDAYSLLVSARHGKFMVNLNDIYIGASLLFYGEWSDEEIDLMKLNLPADGVVVDVGANIGAMTVPLAKHVKQGM
ncbi:hypothetical protein GUITHDRAFT_105845 [Guillardia theta CCMP2712]|uniref:Uncharacterized protein n=1 Tax=Guillardia theta (strain CCMP2712) TaxID=905079 RepID=L1JJB2_GUITC|nr:hypothetical protein GUITHDRAFT_105845 [Guillardia theta CCMP2712]EKX48239.1 hypothetical protein GUITHDRAFT_105845 [Guillardia theta CCMP2712]|eukprot:XP_005835219.1 hypothetical protein GUITHDRAFT_105845 [Guillardia theta CCMP2712]